MLREILPAHSLPAETERGLDRIAGDRIEDAPDEIVATVKG